MAILDTRNVAVSVQSVQRLTDIFSSAGSINGIPAFYSYGEKSIKISYSVRALLLEGEISGLIAKVSSSTQRLPYGAGYSFLGVNGIIEGVSVNDFVRLGGQTYWSATVNLTKYPEYSTPKFSEEIIYEGGTKIIGYYIDGEGYLSDTNNYIKKTKKTIKESELESYEVAPKSSFKPSSSQASSFILSVTPSNYRYIISGSGAATLYLDIEIVELS